MLNIFLNNLINRTSCLLLVTVFLSAFSTGSTALAFCLDEQESHVVGQNLYLVNCHSAVEVGLIPSDEHFSAHVEKGKNECTDVSLTNANILNRPTKIILPVSAKVTLSYTLPGGPVNYQQQVAEYNSSALSQPLFILPPINAHRTVVLLI